jgi:hypothetical protein
MDCGKCGRVIAKSKETKGMKEECTVASRQEDLGSDKGACAQVGWRTSCLWPESLITLRLDRGFLEAREDHADFFGSA